VLLEVYLIVPSPSTIVAATVKFSPYILVISSLSNLIICGALSVIIVLISLTVPS
jgi:hypothetical protein